MSKTSRPFRVRPLHVSIVAALVLLVGVGVGLANKATKPMHVMVKSQIKILEKGPDGKFTQVDELTTTTSKFDASLLELATGESIDSTFTMEAKTKKGRHYTAKLARPVMVSFNAATGQVDADILFDISLDGKSAQVVSKSTTESHESPNGSLKGKRARGILGKGPMTVDLVSANRLELAGEPEMLLVVSTEYKLVPRGSK
jgi:hypothetical protein